MIKVNHSTHCCLPFLTIFWLLFQSTQQLSTRSALIRMGITLPAALMMGGWVHHECPACRVLLISCKHGICLSCWIQGTMKLLSACLGQVSSCAGQAGLPDNLPTRQVKLIPRIWKCTRLVASPYDISSVSEDDWLLLFTVRGKWRTVERNLGK